MLKRFFLALSLIAGLLSPAFGAGSISLSLSQQFDSLGRPLNGGLLYFYAAGTTTPQSAYQDSGLTLPLPNPLTLDSAGRVPQLFFADGSIKIRLTNSAGVVQLAADGILVIGASSGGGGGSPVDPTTVLAPCDIKVVYGTGIVTGFVRMNGRTIGNAVSGATERANADTLAAFSCLYANDNNLVVSGGRGASAAADYAAGKTIATPDYRGRALAGLDDMGNSAAGRLTASYFGTAATVLGAAGGAENQTLTVAQLPTGITTSGSNSISVQPAGAAKGFPVAPTKGNVGSGLANGVSGTFAAPSSTSGSWGGEDTMTGTNTITATSNNTSGSSHPIASPMMLATVYLKL